MTRWSWLQSGGSMRGDGGIAAATRDRTRRSGGRVVSDATLAAAWIDSWPHDDNEQISSRPQR